MIPLIPSTHRPAAFVCSRKLLKRPRANGSVDNDIHYRVECTREQRSCRPPRWLLISKMTAGGPFEHPTARTSKISILDGHHHPHARQTTLIYCGLATLPRKWVPEPPNVRPFARMDLLCTHMHYPDTYYGCIMQTSGMMM